MDHPTNSARTQERQAAQLAFTLSVFAHKRDAEAQLVHRTWPELLARFDAPEIRAEKDGTLFSPALFDPPHRAKANVRELSLLVLDYDSGLSVEDGLRPWLSLGLLCAYYTTHSHLRVTPDHPEAKARYRVIIPLAEPIPANLFYALWRWAAERSGGAFDPVCKDAGRIYYTPAKASQDAPYEWGASTGAALDWRALDLEAESESRSDGKIGLSKAGNNRRAYGQTALREEAARVLTAANGTRNDLLNRAAFNLGQLVGSGLTENEVIATLERAAIGAGLTEQEARATIRSGLTAGMKEPRELWEKRDEKWPEPQPIPNGLLPVPNLPKNLIPKSLLSWLADIAERLQVPLEFPSTAAIVGLASVIGNQIRIKPKRRDDWTVTPNLWGAIIGRPGVMKSPAIAETLKPIYRLIKEAEEQYNRDKKEWRFDKEAAEVQRAALREQMKRAAKTGGNLEQFRDDLSEEEPEEPHERRFIVNDTTVEKFGELLNQNPGGLLIFRDELIGWLRSLDDEQRAKDRAFFLEAWNGDGCYAYDRIGRGTLKIDCVTTSIFGGIQPSKLEVYLRGALEYGDDDDGLMQRFQMMVYPDIPSEWKNVDRWPETDAKNKAYSIYEGLSKIGPQSIGAEQDEEGRWSLHFSNEAQEFFDEWFVDLNQALRSGEFEHPAIEAHFSKYKSLMPSLALIFHLIEIAAGAFEGSAHVSLCSAEMAAAWCQFMMAHARRIYGLGIGAAAIHAKTLAKHLQAGDLQNEFTARDVYFKGWAGLSTAKVVERPLELLESLGWLQSYQSDTGGRPKTLYLINPRIAEVKL
jgi:putative DNA primase/helicase